MMIKIWERYFLKTAARSFFLFIIGFYGLYVLIDYSSHASSFHYNHIRFQWSELITYYACEFIERMDVLIPFAILIATIRTLSNLNIHNELVALLACGVKLKRLMLPFVLSGLLFTGLMYLNNELLLPTALREIKHIDNTHKGQKNKTNQNPSVQHVALEDQTTLIFQSYDSLKQSFFDAYWIPTINEVYRIKYLYPYAEIPHGRFVDHMMRNKQGELVVIESFEEKNFPRMQFNKQTLLETITSPDEQSITSLWEKLPERGKIQSEKESQIATNFYYKLVMPWFCLLAVVGPIPFCVRFTRTLPIFFIYASSIFGLVACYLLMDAALVLGERQVLPPLLVICVPFLLFFGIFSFRFLSLR